MKQDFIKNSADILCSKLQVYLYLCQIWYVYLLVVTQMNDLDSEFMHWV